MNTPVKFTSRLIPVICTTTEFQDANGKSAFVDTLWTELGERLYVGNPKEAELLKQTVSDLEADLFKVSALNGTLKQRVVELEASVSVWKNKCEKTILEKKAAQSKTKIYKYTRTRPVVHAIEETLGDSLWKVACGRKLSRQNAVTDGPNVTCQICKRTLAKKAPKNPSEPQ